MVGREGITRLQICAARQSTEFLETLSGHVGTLLPLKGALERVSRVLLAELIYSFFVETFPESIARRPG